MLAALLAACGHSKGGSNTAADTTPSSRQSVPVPLGHAAGQVLSPEALATRNPYEGDERAREEGYQLFIKMNCANCHAYDGSGNMAPTLTDTEWRYGGLPIQIFNTIHDGRPQGMPAWGEKLTNDQIWKLVTVVESFGGAFPADYYKHAPQGDADGENEAPEAYDQVQPPPPLAAPPDPTNPPPPGVTQAPPPATRPR
jgi:cytochrome c oxidase cbb3-type subunit 3